MLPTPSVPVMQVCEVHGRNWTKFCHNCDIALCSLCADKHTNHAITSYLDAIIIIRGYITKEIKKAENLNEKLLQLVQLRRESLLQFDSTCEIIQQYLAAERASMNHMLQQVLYTIDFLKRQGKLMRTAVLPELHKVYGRVRSETFSLNEKCEKVKRDIQFDNSLHQPLPTLSVEAEQSTPSRAIPSVTWTYLVSLEFIPAIVRNPVQYRPQYYFDVKQNLTFMGRIIVETRPDVAPIMSSNFGALCVSQTEQSYKNCSFFQCWEGESIITGDYETNNGLSSTALLDDGAFLPETTRLAPVRGAVGMRRTQKRHDKMGQVGSQFRIIIEETRKFSAIFGHVIEGMEVVEEIAKFGDIFGMPSADVVISDCGRLN